MIMDTDEILDTLEEKITHYRAISSDDQRPIWGALTVVLVVLRGLCAQAMQAKAAPAADAPVADAPAADAPAQ